MTEDISSENQNVLEDISWTITVSQGEFRLLLIRCNYLSLRDELSQQLQQVCPLEIQVLNLKASEQTLYNRIQLELGTTQPNALMVFGLEMVDNLEHLLSAANQVREEFQKNFHFPLLLWVNDEVFIQLVRVAPDFESWANTTELLISQEQLGNLLKDRATEWFNDRLIITQSESLELQAELTSAYRDLQRYNEVLDQELVANLESLLGSVKFINNKIDEALAHYQKAADIWREINQLDRLGIVLREMTLCYYQKALPDRDIEDAHWQLTKNYLLQSIEILQAANRLDLIANCLLNFGIILRRLKDWQLLESLARQSLQLHQDKTKSLQLAQDYGFLAEVALARQDWLEAKKLAENTITLLNSITDENSSDLIRSYLVSQCYFILAQVQQNLGETAIAIAKLEKAKKISSPEYDTQFYLEIINYLQKLYFEQHQYQLAFEIKLERQSIEQQYGLRAFIGAGRLQAQKQAKLTITQDKSVENVASEIVASGRDLDVNKLIQRIGEPSYKLIVIHGQSGVGKSSLVNGGLIPALKRKSIGIQDVLSIAMRVYTDWIRELGRLLGEALLARKIVDEKILSLTSRDISEEDILTIIIEQLQKSESYNLRPVLIFDQFEEFFFVYSNPVDRIAFSQFLGNCLKIGYVKVILSLREDYLHYLLEWENQDSMNSIGNDILCKNIRYHLGNFSPDAATTIIRNLTERANFKLDEVLIKELVKDLAGELGEVRPIELQIVGAQLQTENITTLAQYQNCGENATEELVKRYLAEVVNDCGKENEQIAELVLFLLTDEKINRPLKTRTELDRDVQALATNLSLDINGLDLVLNIFVGSGLVLLLPEKPEDRYQLVHDYLAAFIRQQKPKLNEIIAELEKEKEKNRIAQEKLQQSEETKKILETANKTAKQRIKIGSAFLGISLLVAVGTGIYATQNLRETKEIGRLELEGVSILRQFESGQSDSDQMETLVSAMRAGQDLKSLVKNRPLKEYPIVSPLLALETILDNIREKSELKGDQISVNSNNFSPQCDRIVTTSDNKTARVWDLSGKLLAELKGHQISVNSNNFSSQCDRIVTTSDDKTARVWDLSGKLLAELKGHHGRVYSANFSPQGDRIVTTSDDKTARVWDLSGKLLVQLKGHHGRVYSANFSPQGDHIVTTTSDDKTAQVWDLSGKLLAELKGHHGRVNSANFSPQGDRIVTTSDDKTARVWDLSGKLLAELKGHQSSFNSANFSPQGDRIVTTSDDKTARVWDLSGKLLAELKGHQDYINSANFSPQGDRIVTTSDDKTARVWDLSGKLLAELKGHQDWVRSANFSPQSDRIVTTSDDKTARVWDLSEKLLAELKGHQSSFNSANFSPQGDRIVTTALNDTLNDKTARVWDLSGKLLAELKGHQDWVRSANFSPQGDRIVTTAFNDKTARVWDLSGKLLAELKGHQDWVSSANFSPQGDRIVTTAFNDKTARVWDLSGKLLAELKSPQNGVSSANFSPQGDRIVTTALNDKIARVWDLSGKLLAELKGHQNSVLSANFSPQGNRIVTTALNDKTARVWDLSGKLLAELKGPQYGPQHSVIKANFSPQGDHIVTISFDKTARVWDLSGKLLAELKGHHDYVNSANFSPQGDRIFTTLHDTAQVWDLSGRQLAEFKQDYDHSKFGDGKANFSPDGNLIIFLLGNTAKIWQIKSVGNLDLLLERGCKWLNYYLINHPKELEKLEICQNDSNKFEAAPFMFEEGEIEARSGNIDNAVSNFSIALKWNPKLNFDPNIKAQQLAKANNLVKQGEELAQTGDIKNINPAISLFQQAVKLDPNLDFQPEQKAKEIVAGNLVYKGEELAQTGNIKDAVTIFKQALKLDPSLDFQPEQKAKEMVAGNLVYKAAELAKTGNIKDAVTIFKQALKLDPSLDFQPEQKANEVLANDLVNKGEKLAKTGNIKDAVTIFKQAIKLDPNLDFQPEQKAKEIAESVKNSEM